MEGVLMVTVRSALSTTLAVLVALNAVAVGAIPAAAGDDGTAVGTHDHSHEEGDGHSHEEGDDHSHDHADEEDDDGGTSDEVVTTQSVANQSRAFVSLDEAPTIVIVSESDQLATESAREDLEMAVEQFFGQHAGRGRIGAVNAVVEHVERVGTEGGTIPVDPRSIVESARESGELGTNGRADLSGIGEQDLVVASEHGEGELFETGLPDGPSEGDITSGANEPGGVMMGGGIGTGGEGIETPEGATSDSGGEADLSGHANAAAGGLTCWAICAAADGTLPVADAGCAVACSVGFYEGQQEAKEDMQESDSGNDTPNADEDTDGQRGDSNTDNSDDESGDSSSSDGDSTDDSSSSDGGSTDDSSSSDGDSTDDSSSSDGDSTDDSSSSDSDSTDDSSSSDSDSTDDSSSSDGGSTDDNSSSDGSQGTDSTGMPAGPHGPGGGCGPRMHCREGGETVVEADAGNDIERECTVMMPTGPGSRCGGQGENTVVEVDAGNDVERGCTVMMPTGPGGECGTDDLQPGRNGAVGEQDHCRYMMPSGPGGACSEDGSGPGETDRPGGTRGPGRTAPARR